MSLNGKMLKEAFLSGTSLVVANKEYINELNVFPVPDGDTGTNMSMTLQSACDMLDSVNEKDNNNQLEEKGKVLRGKKKKKDLNPVDKMGEDDDQIQEIREQNEEMTQQVHEKVEEKQSKCKCFIF